ncbi:MAG: radical SAM protein, partial [Candidatus Omnitrophica bacterium]|nr:radical SAM protein [Candidatus Omnitrophota bacterium]
MPLKVNDINKITVNNFRFKKLNGEYLLTNDVGAHSFLDLSSFEEYLSGNIKDFAFEKYSELLEKGFIRDHLDFDGLSRKLALKNQYLNQGPNLHIIVVTLRCDHKCIYCHASAKLLTDKGFDMDIPIAQKVVDRIFESPNDNITIEFQGGEPLVNFDTVKFIIAYAKKRNKDAKKKLLISLVTNLSLMTDERLDFLIKNKVALCTSLDGPESLHNKHRVLLRQGNSYKNTVNWIKKIQKKIGKNKAYGYKMNALTTITRFSLPYYKQIVNEFVGLGFDGIHLRPVTPFGLYNESERKHIWPSASEFLDFYKKALEYIIGLNHKGANFYERTAKIFLAKILTEEDP